ncbi:hypothetical protein MNJPNG_04760 [Cupriavidus oxalaticus]|uniref:hypothetical protein n=1 Tax=Cupriavidus oxalaticus TaxID=96344 RepID=UPI003F736583
MTEKNNDHYVLAKQVADWGRERDRLNDLIAHATGHPAEAQQSEAVAWQPITAPGQVSIGDKLHFTIGDTEYRETVKDLIDPGTDREEIIYNIRRNYYLITSMCMQNKGSQKNVRFLRAEPMERIVAPSRHSGDAEEMVAPGSIADVLNWMDEEISAVDCRYRGDPSYDHDAYWFKEKALKLVAEARNVFAAAPSNRGGDAESEERPCTCHPSDNPPNPCAKKYALSECRASQSVEPVALTVDYAEAGKRLMDACVQAGCPDGKNMAEWIAEIAAATGAQGPVESALSLWQQWDRGDNLCAQDAMVMMRPFMEQIAAMYREQSQGGE